MEEYTVLFRLGGFLLCVNKRLMKVHSLALVVGVHVH